MKSIWGKCARASAGDRINDKWSALMILVEFKSTMELAAHAVIPRRASGAFGRLDIACTAPKPRMPPATTVKKSAADHRGSARAACSTRVATTGGGGRSAKRRDVTYRYIFSVTYAKPSALLGVSSPNT